MYIAKVLMHSDNILCKFKMEIIDSSKEVHVTLCVKYKNLHRSIEKKTKKKKKKTSSSLGEICVEIG